MTHMAVAHYSRLDDERWGERIRRARTRTKLGLRDAAEILDEFTGGVSWTTLSRLELEPEPPTARRRRITATLYVLALGYDPSDFDLDRNELPSVYDDETIKALTSRASASPSQHAGSGSSPRRSG